MSRQIQVTFFSASTIFIWKIEKMEKKLLSLKRCLLPLTFSQPALVGVPLFVLVPDLPLDQEHSPLLRLSSVRPGQSSSQC